MSYKIGSLPSPRASLEDLADYMEIECLNSIEKSFSVTDAAQKMGIIDDESTPIDEEDENLEQLKLALSRTEDRAIWSSCHYPFITDVFTVSCNSECADIYRIVYTFLLLSTRENMSEDKRMVDGLDGTKLFEQLSVFVLKRFFGDNSHCFVFGTGAEVGGAFICKIQKMLDSFVEKGYSITDKPLNPYQKDGGIDLVAFTPFADKRKGHFIVFGQCKTGTSWQNNICPIIPEILDDYINPSFVSKPYACMMVTEDCGNPEDWTTMARKVHGVLFDRCRLMHFLPEKIDDNLLHQIENWNTGVLNRYKH